MATRTSGRNEDRPNNARSGSNAGGNPGATSTSGGRKDTTSNAQSQNQSQQSSGRSAPTSSSDQERQLNRSREQGSVRGGTARANVSPQQGGGPAPSYYGGSSPFAMMRRMMDDMDRLVSDFGFVQPGLLASSFFGPDAWSSLEPSRQLGSGQSSAGSQRALSGSTSGQRGGLQPWSEGLWSPQVDVFERGNNLVVRADLPGLDRDNIDVEVENDSLIIRGERRSENEDNQEGYYRSERSYGSFYRAIPLPDGVDANACNATFKDGVLEVTLPKPPESKSKGKRIEVK
jgi:HSP20 family protein